MSKPIVIFGDKNVCIIIANIPTSHTRSENVDIRYHFSREQFEKNETKLFNIPTGIQLANINKNITCSKTHGAEERTWIKLIINLQQ